MNFEFFRIVVQYFLYGAIQTKIRINRNILKYKSKIMNKSYEQTAQPLLPIGINMDFLNIVFMDPRLTGTLNPLFTVIAINSKAQSTFVP